jgi:exosortase/archaeosortase family protein
VDLDKNGISLSGVLLLLLFPFVWLVDLSWWSLSPDVIVVALLFPLAWIFAFQMRRAEVKEAVIPRAPSKYLTISGSVLFLFGLLLGHMSLTACAWALLAVEHLLPQARIQQSRLFILCLGAFPWILVDGGSVGWVFRLSGATVTGALFGGAGFDVLVRGTQLSIDGLPISIEAACGGLQSLQVLMSGGIALNFMCFKESRGFWLVFVMLPIIAWLANTTRIIVITAWALKFGPESAAGAFHTWGALLVFCLMLVGVILLSDFIRQRLNS